MPSLAAFRFQLRSARPSARAQLRRIAGGLRWVWNRALAEQRERHARGEPYASYIDMAKWLTAWRNAPETAWLAEGPIHPQQQVLRRLDEAYKRFFAAAKAGRAASRGGVKPPHFKRRGEEPGIRFPDPKQFVLDAANGRIRLPKLGWVRLRLSQPVVGTLRNVSLSQEGSSWYCSIQVERSEVAPALGLQPSLGIDLGLTAFAATSEGELVAPLKALCKQQVRLKRYQRAVSRKKKGSANRRKAIDRLARLHQKIAAQRSDWLHKLTTQLADAHPVIALEDLRIKNMSSSAKGAVESPAKNVRQKAGLNRGILDAAWGEFRRQLDYKLQWRGGQLVLVNPAYTSRTCRMCGHEAAENRKTQSAFACVACGHTENADVHAAKNILTLGLALWGEQHEAAGHDGLGERKLEPNACGGAVRRPRIRKFGSSGAALKNDALACASGVGKQEPTEGRARAGARADSVGIPVL